MTAKQILLFLLEHTYEREGAYPPLAKALAGVTATQASWKPSPERHSIWQIVRHMTQWMEAGFHAIEAEPQVYEDLQKSDWRPVSGDDREWQSDVERLHRAYRQLKERLTAMSDDDLGEMIEPYRGKPRYETAFRFIRTATHDTYHLGQIRYLRALQSL